MKKDWKKEKIEQCFKVKSGDFLPANKMAKEGNIDVYGGNGIAGKHNQHNLTGENIIIGRVGAKCGNVKRVSGNIWVTDNAFYISELLEEFDLTFLEYLLITKNLRNTANQTAQPVISYTTIKNVILIVPPLPEQKRIVAIVDHAFEGIDRAIANTEKNLANARELFESYLNKTFTQKSDEWIEKKLQDILRVQPRNGWSPPAQNHSDTGTPVLTLSSVTGFQFNKRKVKFTNAVTKKDAHYWLKNGEFLISRSNTTELVGHVAICEGLTEPTICCDLIMKMQLDPEQADIRFIYWHFRTHALRGLISGSAQGANPTMKKINKSIVQNLPVVLPKISIQKDIVAKIDALATETQHLEAIYRQKRTALNELKQAILQKAFTGELTVDTANQTTKAAEEVIAA